MGKQAVTEVQAGAEGSGEAAEAGSPLNATKLDVVNSPKREKILIGMLKEVGSKGYDVTSVRTILDRTGLYRQAFYDNFPDKDSCYLAALDAGLARIDALARAAAASEESWKRKLRAGLGAVLDFLDSEPDIGRALIVEVHAAGPKALSRRAAAMKEVTDFIDLARLEVKGSESPPAIAPEGIVAGIHAVVHSRLSTGADEGFRQLLPEFMYFAVLPYFGVEAASAEMQAARMGSGLDSR
jgi:AcrR family transcriptional regulator